MTTLTSNDVSHSVPVLTSNSGAFFLEVKQPHAEDRRIQLFPGKCTIGSSERCQVHIEGTAVRPLHCLLVLEGSTLTVTRWAQGALLNGRDFATAPFQLGDTLQVGETTISLIADRSENPGDQAPNPSPSTASVSNFTTPQAPTTGTHFVPPSPPLSRPQSPTSFPTNQAAQTREQAFPTADAEEALTRLRSAKETARGRCRKLVTVVRSMRDEANNFDRRIDHLESQLNLAMQEREQLNSQLSSLQSESTDRESQTAQEIDRLISELSDAYEKANAAETALLDSGQHTDQLRGEFEQRLADTEAQLKASEDAFAALEENSTQVRVELEQQLAQVQRELETKACALSEAEHNSEAFREQLERQLSESQEKQNAVEESLASRMQEIQQLEADLVGLRSDQQQWEQTREAGELQRTKLAQALADRERSVDTLQAELEQFRQAADQADDSRMEQAAELSKVQAELELLQSEREQLSRDLANSQQYHADLEQTVADSEQNLEVFQLELEKFQLTSRQTEQELADSSAELERVRTEFAQLVEERDQLKAKRTEYQLREQGREHEIATRDAQIEELTREIEALKGSVAEASQGAAEQGSQVEKLEREADELRSERDQLMNVQAEQVQNLKAWEEAVESRDRRISELEAEHDGICQVLQSVEKGAFEQVDACNKLQEQLADLREERDQFANALPEQQEYAKQLEQALAERDGQITLLSEELSKASDRFGDLESQLASGATSLEVLEAERNDWKLKCEQLASTQSSQEASRSELEAALTEYQQQVEQLRQQVENSDKQCRELEQIAAEGTQSKDSYQLELSELKSRYEQLISEHQSEQQRRQQLDTELAERDQNLELFQVDLKSMRAELDRSEQQLKNLEDERSTLNLQLTGLRDELAAKETNDDSPAIAGQSNLQAERDELAAELESVRSQFEELQLRNVEGAETEDVSKASLSGLEREISELQQCLDQREMEAKQVEAELEETLSKLEAGKIENEELNKKYQQSQSDLEKAEQTLLVAEQSLRDQAEVQQPESALPNFDATSTDLPTTDDLSAEETSTQDTSLSGISPDESVYPFDVSGADFSRVSEQQTEGERDAYSSNDAADQHEPSSAADAAEQSEPEGISWEVRSEDADTAEADVSEESAAAFAARGSQSLADGEHDETEDYISTEYRVASNVEADSAESDYEEDFEAEADEDAELVLDVSPEEQDLEDAQAAEAGEPLSVQEEVPTEEPAEEPAEEFKPTSFIDQFAHLLEEDGEGLCEPAQPEPAKPAPVENKLSAELDAIQGEHEDDSDEALQAYMSNMLRRMRGDSNDEEASPPQQSQATTLNQNPNPVSAVSEVLSNVAPKDQTEAPIQDPILDLESLKRTSEKPELPTDLAAMRELANASARKAIAKHHKKRHLEKALGLFFVCLISICVGGYMLLTATTAQDYTGVNFIGGAIAMLVGVGGGLKLLGLLLAAIREGSIREPKSAK